MTRLFNFIIDTGVYGIVLFGSLFLFRNIIPEEFSKLFGIILFLAYYFLFELFLNQTIGKMITKTKIVRLTDFHKPPSLWQILIRTIVRVLPVDILSYLFFRNGLHDMLSRTTVIPIHPNVIP